MCFCDFPIGHCTPVQCIGTAVFDLVQLDGDRIGVARCMTMAFVVDLLAFEHDTWL
jgi:hypothetical protein